MRATTDKSCVCQCPLEPRYPQLSSWHNPVRQGVLSLRPAPQRFEGLLGRRGVEIFYGKGSFVDPHTIQVVRPTGEELALEGDKILVAAGSSPIRPPEFPFHDERVRDSNQILELKTLPKRLAIIGAGVIGSEYACTFAAIGTEVHLIDGRHELLPFLDKEVSAALGKAMSDGGVIFRWGERVIECDV